MQLNASLSSAFKIKLPDDSNSNSNSNRDSQDSLAALQRSDSRENRSLSDVIDISPSASSSTLSDGSITPPGSLSGSPRLRVPDSPSYNKCDYVTRCCNCNFSFRSELSSDKSFCSKDCRTSYLWYRKKD